MKFLILLFIIVAPFRFYKIDSPLANITNFRQAQTATFALNFYKNGINLFQTELDIFGTGKERYLTLEFPFYETIVSLLYKLFFVSDVWGRLVSVTAGYIGAFYLYKLILLLTTKRKIALFSTFFFLFVPINMYHQKDFLMEATIIAFLLSGFYYFLHFIRYKDNKSYFLAIILVSLGYVQKGMYGPFWLLPFVWYYLYGVPFRSRLRLKLVLLTAIPLLLLFFWQKNVDYKNTINGHEYFTSQSLAQLEWNIGRLSDRLSLPLWEFRLRQVVNGLFLKPGLLIFFLGLIFAGKIKNSEFLYLWLIAEISYFLVFFRIQSHLYYQMVMTPVTSVFMAIGLLKLGKYMRKLGIVIFCVFYIWRSYLSSQWDQYIDWKWYGRLQQIKQVVSSESSGILVNPGYDWNSVYTYYPRLKLKMVGAEIVSEDKVLLWKSLGYSYIILHEYDRYPDYLENLNSTNSLDFLDNRYRQVLSLEDFKVYLFNSQSL